MRRISRFVLLYCFASLLAISVIPLQLHGQAVYGSISGTVTDNNGAVVPNATVTFAGPESTASSSSPSRLPPTSKRRLLSPRGRLHFVQTPFEESALAVIRHQLQRAAVGLRGLLRLPEPPQQIRARGMQ